MLQFVEKQKGVFGLTGSENYRKQNYKEVVVEGETYTKWYSEDAVFNPEEDKYDTLIKLPITPFGLTYYVEQYNTFELGIYRKFCKYTPSQNEIAALYQMLFDNKKLDKRIISIHAGKHDYGYRSFEYDLKYRTTLDLVVYGYGFNNFVTIEIKMKDFLLIEDKKNIYNYYDLKEHFDTVLNVDLEKHSAFEISQKIMKYKIANKK